MPHIDLRDYQLDAVERMKTGCILCGGVGSGKSRTSLAYYYKEHGGNLYSEDYVRMTNPKDLYIITTARKRDTLEWEEEMPIFRMTTNPEVAMYDHKIVVDSWNNIKKYQDVKDAFFILDEQRLVGYGVWAHAFFKIAKHNDWILLTATPGDTWTEYMTVFIANGFYKHKTDFESQHVIYSPYSKFKKVDRYVNVRRLTRLRDSILIDMEFERHTVSHNIDVYVKYNTMQYKDIGKTRWNPYKEQPIQNAGELCYTWRRVVNSDPSRQVALLEIFEKHPKMIVFYNYDYELEILKGLYYGEREVVEVAEWNGHKHQPIPTGESWVYLVQYTAGCEGWNCIKTDTIVFYSQNYSYKVMEQARGRIDRMNTPFTDLYYYHLRSRSGIDLAISRALAEKKTFNEGRYVNRRRKNEMSVQKNNEERSQVQSRW